MKERRRSRRGLAEVTVWVPAEKADAVRNYAYRIGQRRAPPQREDVVAGLRRQRALLDRFGVLSLALFGSAARNQAHHHSDIDLLVEFAPGRPSGLFEFIELKHVLEGVLGRPVDLTIAANLKPRLKTRIFEDLVPVL